MPDAENKETTIDVAAITRQVTEGVVAAFKPQLEELAANQKIFADTYAADKAAAATAAGEKSGDAEQPKPLTAEEIKKLLAEGITAHTQAQQQTADQKAVREAFIGDPKNGLAKLSAAHKAQLGNDPAKWAEEAKKITSEWETFAKDNKFVTTELGGSARDGGTAPGGGGAAERKPGSWIKMPAA